MKVLKAVWHSFRPNTHAAFLKYDAARKAARKVVRRDAIDTAIAAYHAGRIVTRSQIARIVRDSKAGTDYRRTRNGRPIVSIDTAAAALAEFLNAEGTFAQEKNKVRDLKKRHRYHLISMHKIPDRPIRNMSFRTGAEIRDELSSQRRDDVRRYFHSAYRNGDCEIRWVENLAECGVDVEYDEEYMYKGRFASWPAKTWRVTVRAMQMYSRELPDGRRKLLDLCTLGAVPYPTTIVDSAAWIATWARKSRGVSWAIEHGIIYMSPGGEYVHQTIRGSLRPEQDYEAALQAAIVLGRRRDTAVRHHAEGRPRYVGGIEIPAERRGEYHDLCLSIAAGRDGGYGAVPVSRRHARAAGYCDPGIQAWIDRYCPGRTRITVTELLDHARRDRRDRRDMAKRVAQIAIVGSWVRDVRRR